MKHEDGRPHARQTAHTARREAPTNHTAPRSQGWQRRGAEVLRRPPVSPPDVSNLQSRKRELGNLLLVTTPAADADERYRKIAQAISGVMPVGTLFNLSIQRPAAIGRELYEVERCAVAVATELSILVGKDLVGHHIASYRSEQDLDVSKLLEAVDSSEAAAPVPNPVHVAIIGGLGLVGVNLRDERACQGDTFVQLGLGRGHPMQWERIYKSPLSDPGPYHIA